MFNKLALCVAKTLRPNSVLCVVTQVKVFYVSDSQSRCRTPCLLILVAVAFIAGFIDAIAGGGLLTIPALLMSGLPPHLVVGTLQTLRDLWLSNGKFCLLSHRFIQSKQWRNGLNRSSHWCCFRRVIGATITCHWLNQIFGGGLCLCIVFAVWPHTTSRRSSTPIVNHTAMATRSNARLL